MKKIIISICIICCFSFLVSCGNTAETTSSAETNSLATVEDSDETYDIETSIVTLKYPVVWKDVVQVDVTNEGAKFSTNGKKLFDIMFVETEDGYLLGTYNGTPIYATVYEEDTTTDDQLSMISDINVIFENLEADPNFTISN